MWSEWANIFKCRKHRKNRRHEKDEDGEGQKAEYLLKRQQWYKGTFILNLFFLSLHFRHVMKSLDLQNRKRMESRETKEETSDAFGEFDESRLPPFGDSPFNPTSHRSSWSGYDQQGQQQPRQLHRSSQLNSDMEHETRTRTPVDLLTSFDFDIMRLTDSQVPTSAGTSDSSSSGSSWYWRLVGNISSDGKTFLERQSFPSYSESIPHLSSSFFPQSKSSSFPPWTTRGGGFRKSRYRVVTAIAPPFVQESTRIRNASCLTGVPCLRVSNSLTNTED